MSWGGGGGGVRYCTIDTDVVHLGPGGDRCYWRDQLREKEMFCMSILLL